MPEEIDLSEHVRPMSKEEALKGFTFVSWCPTTQELELAKQADKVMVVCFTTPPSKEDMAAIQARKLTLPVDLQNRCLIYFYIGKTFEQFQEFFYQELIKQSSSAFWHPAAGTTRPNKP